MLATILLTRLFTGEKKLTPHDLADWGFWSTLFKESSSAALAFTPRLFIAIVFFSLFWGIYRILGKIIGASMRRANVDTSIHEMLSRLTKWSVMGAGLIVSLNQVGIQLTPLLTGASIAGLAVGLAAQETLANFIAGIVIFWDKPFRVGDCVDIDSACGTVQRVTFRSTRLLTFDGEIVVLPNTAVLARRLINHTAHHTGRVNINVGISYSASIEDARQALLSMVATDDRIAESPEPAVLVNELAESSVKLHFWFWTKERTSVARLKFEYMEKVKNALDAAGIEVAYPRMNILWNGRNRQVGDSSNTMHAAA